MTVANLFGVPLGTTLSEALSWRATFLLVGCWGLVVLLFVWRWVPQVGGLPDTGFKGQFRFFRKKAPWLLLGATLLGNRRRILLVQLYQSAADSRCGFPGGRRFGADGAGRIRHVRRQLGRRPPVGPLYAGAGGRLGAGDYLRCPALTFSARGFPWLAVALMCVCTSRAVRGVESSAAPAAAPFRGRRAARAASVQVAFNLGNAIGAYCGGLPLEAGLGYEYPALIGAPFALAGFVLLTVFYRRYEPSGRPATTACVILSVWLRNDLSPRLPKRRGGSESGKGVRRLVRWRPILIYSPALSVRCSPGRPFVGLEAEPLAMRLTKVGPL